jgi:hypothetical protein
VTKVKTASAGSTSGVEEEGLAVLVLGKDLVEVAMAKEEAASEPAMRLLARHLLKSLEKLMVDLGGLPLSVYILSVLSFKSSTFPSFERWRSLANGIVVNRSDFTILALSSLNGPGVDVLVLNSSLGRVKVRHYFDFNLVWLCVGEIWE